MRNCSSWCSRVHIPETSSSSFDSEVEEVVDDDAAASPDSSRRSGVLREAPEDGDDEEEDDAEALPALEGKEEEEDWLSSSPSSISDRGSKKNIKTDENATMAKTITHYYRQLHHYVSPKTIPLVKYHGKSA